MYCSDSLNYFYILVSIYRDAKEVCAKSEPSHYAISFDTHFYMITDIMMKIFSNNICLGEKTENNTMNLNTYAWKYYWITSYTSEQNSMN